MRISQDVKQWAAIPQKVDGRWHSLGTKKKTLMASIEARPAPLPTSWPSSPPEPNLPRAPGLSASAPLAEMTSTTRTPFTEFVRTINNPGNESR
jgi:hypothetical protein